MLQIRYRLNIQFLHKTIYPKHVIIQVRSNTGKIYNLYPQTGPGLAKLLGSSLSAPALPNTCKKYEYYTSRKIDKSCVLFFSFSVQLWHIFSRNNRQKLYDFFLFFSTALTYFLQNFFHDGCTHFWKNQVYRPLIFGMNISVFSWAQRPFRMCWHLKNSTEILIHFVSLILDARRPHLREAANPLF